jgi:hypothetical protein
LTPNASSSRPAADSSRPKTLASATVAVALPHLIERRRPAGDERRADQRVREQAERDAVWRGEVQPAERREQHEQVQPRLRQHDEVADGAGVRGRHAGRVCLHA